MCSQNIAYDNINFQLHSRLEQLYIIRRYAVQLDLRENFVVERGYSSLNCVTPNNLKIGEYSINQEPISPKKHVGNSKSVKC